MSNICKVFASLKCSALASHQRRVAQPDFYYWYPFIYIASVTGELCGLIMKEKAQVSKSWDHTFRHRHYIQAGRPPPCSVLGQQPRLRLGSGKKEAVWLNHLWIIESRPYLFSIWQLSQLFPLLCTFSWLSSTLACLPSVTWLSISRDALWLSFAGSCVCQGVEPVVLST